MTAKPASVAARAFHLQAVHYYRHTINFNDANISNAAASDPFGALPLGAAIVGVQVEIITPFNAGTTNVLTVGTTTANANEIVAAGDVDETVAGVTIVTRTLGSSLARAAQQNLYAKYTQSGGAATAGQAIVTILYTANNDS